MVYEKQNIIGEKARHELAEIIGAMSDKGIYSVSLKIDYEGVLEGQ